MKNVMYLGAICLMIILMCSCGNSNSNNKAKEGYTAREIIDHEKARDFLDSRDGHEGGLVKECDGEPCYHGFKIGQLRYVNSSKRIEIGDRLFFYHKTYSPTNKYFVVLVPEGKKHRELYEWCIENLDQYYEQ